MKTNLIAIVLLFIGMRAVCGIKPVDPDKPLYQLDWGIMPPGNMWIGGKLSERQIPKAKTATEQQLQAKLDNIATMAAKGRKSISIGISALVLGIMVLLYLNNNPLQWIGAGITGFGIWRFASGIIEVKLAENWQVTTAALFVGLIVTITAVILWNSGADLGAILGRIKKRVKRSRK